MRRFCHSRVSDATPQARSPALGRTLPNDRVFGRSVVMTAEQYRDKATSMENGLLLYGRLGVGRRRRWEPRSLDFSCRLYKNGSEHICTNLFEKVIKNAAFYNVENTAEQNFEFGILCRTFYNEVNSGIGIIK